jgi:hypothetical protein
MNLFKRSSGLIMVCDLARSCSPDLDVSIGRCYCATALASLTEIERRHLDAGPCAKRMRFSNVPNTPARIKKTNLRNHRRLLRTRRERPYSRCAAEKSDELASFHSITSSARASSDGGTVRPSALAVLRLIASSYLFGACTGRSAGFSPFKMRST